MKHQYLYYDDHMVALRKMFHISALAVLTTLACTSRGSGGTDGEDPGDAGSGDGHISDAGNTQPDAGQKFNPDAGVTEQTCAAYTFTHALPTDWSHTATCDDACGNGLNPPTGGPHCASPLACSATFSTAQKRCEWIHNLEHGHLVLLYNCPGGCPDIVAALEAVRDETTAGTNAVRRVVITPDLLIPTKVAAIVAGWSYTAETVDALGIRCLLTHQDFEAPERNLNCAP